jgi:hypothetical protein
MSPVVTRNAVLPLPTSPAGGGGVYSLPVNGEGRGGERLSALLAKYSAGTTFPAAGKSPPTPLFQSGGWSSGGGDT